MSDLAGVAAAVYAVDLADFVTERDRRAAQARSDGDRPLATAIKALRKPSIGAWAANLLARERPDVLDDVARTGGLLRQAQRELDRPRLRELDGERRRVLADAVGVGEELGAGRGQALGAAAVSDLESILRAAMTDPRAEAALRSGLLTRAMEVTGLGTVDLDGVLAVPGVVPDAPADDDEPAPRRRAHAATGGGRGAAKGTSTAARSEAAEGERRRAAGGAAGAARREGKRSARGERRDEDAARGSRAAAHVAGEKDAADDVPAVPQRPSAAETKRRRRAVERAEAALKRAQGRAAKAATAQSAADERAREVQARILQLESELDELRRGIAEREHALERATDALENEERKRDRAARKASDAQAAADDARAELDRAREPGGDS